MVCECVCVCVCAYVSVAFGSKGVGVHHDGRAVLLCSLAEPLCPLESGRLLPGQEIGLPLETLAPGGAPVPAGTDGRCSGVVRSGPLCPLESGRLLLESGRLLPDGTKEKRRVCVCVINS